MLSEIQWIPILTLVGIIFYQGYLLWHLQKLHQETQKDLLDRIMANDYHTYINGEAVREQFNLPPERVEEQGIPI